MDLHWHKVIYTTTTEICHVILVSFNRQFSTTPFDHVCTTLKRGTHRRVYVSGLPRRPIHLQNKRGNKVLGR